MITQSPIMQDVQAFRAWLAATMGLRFDDNRDAWLAQLLTRRASSCGASSTQAYLEQLRGAAASLEMQALAPDLTVPETCFFRNIEQLHVLRDVAVPACQQLRLRDKSLRILSAGCATGEEAYSIAMVLAEMDIGAACQVRIDALDINPQVLAHAQRGRYGDWSLRDTPVEMRQKWFKQDGAWHVLDTRIQEQVHFETRNLVADDPAFWTAGRYDVIFCRNVLMYFTPDQYRAVVQRLTSSLIPGGYLFLGYAENLRGISQDVDVLQSHGTYCYRRCLPDQAPAPKGAAGRKATQARLAPAMPQAVPGERSRSPLHRQRVLASASESLTLAYSLFAQEQFQQAWTVLQAAPEHDTQAPRALCLRAALLLQQGQLAQARALCEEMAAQGQVAADAHHIMALCNAREGNVVAALGRVRTACQIDPTFAMARLQAGLLYSSLGEREASQRALLEAHHLILHESEERVVLFGGGFRRHALASLCLAQIKADGAAS